MTAAHNHDPSCCCWTTVYEEPRRCPACATHGDLAQLATPESAEPRPGECPRCHQPIGRPHTDYCPFDGIVSILATPDGPRIEIMAATPRQAGKVSGQALAALRNQIDRWHQDGPDSAHETWQCNPDLCGRTPLATPIPPDCPTCHHPIDVSPGYGCTTPAAHDHPR